MRFMIYGADSGQLRLAVHRPAISVTPINGSAAAWADTSASLDVYQLHLGRLLENVVGLSHISHYQAQHGCDAPVADDSSAVGSLNPAAVLEGASCCCQKKLRWCNLCVLVALDSEPVEFDLGTAEQAEASLPLAEQSSAAHWQMPLLVNFAWTSLPDGHLVLDGSVAIGTTADTEAAVWDASASAGPAGGGSTNAHFGQPLQLQETYYLGLGKPATVCADSMRTLPWHFQVCTKQPCKLTGGTAGWSHHMLRNSAIRSKERQITRCHCCRLASCEAKGWRSATAMPEQSLMKHCRLHRAHATPQRVPAVHQPAQ